MSISEERMMILKMLQEGRINSDEAAKLLEALDASEKKANAGPGGPGFGGPGAHGGPGCPPPHFHRRPQYNYYDEAAKFRERINEWRRDFAKNYNQKDFDKMVDDFSAKAEKVGKEVASATAGMVDKMVDFVGSFVDTGAFNIFGNCVLVEKTYEAPAVEGSSLELQATNGPITVKKHQEDKVLIKAKIRTPQNNADNVLAFDNSSDTISLKLANNEAFNLSVSYDVFVPAVKFNKLVLETKNSKIYVEDTLSEEFTSITKNGMIDLTGVNSSKVNVDTKNAKVAVNYLIGKEVRITTKNAAIELKNIKAEKLGAYTANGKILLENLQTVDGAEEIELMLQTKNADIKANMNDTDNKGYRVKARTKNGGINLLVPNLLYRNSPDVEGFGKQAEAETENFSNAPQRVTIYAETHNGYIEVIK
jgi:DUF4097 and DUF4098 domain-containing protein YvlB